MQMRNYSKTSGYSLKNLGDFPRITRVFLCLAPLWFMVCSGCGYSGRFVLLEEYEPVTTQQSQNLSLTGLRLYIGPITYDKSHSSHSGENQGEQQDNAAPLTAHTWIEFSQASIDKWTARRQELAKTYQTNPADAIGYYIYVINPPGQWLMSSISNEAMAQGAILVDTPDRADIVLNGTILRLYAEYRAGAWTRWNSDYHVQFVTRINIQRASTPPRAANIRH